MCKLRKGTDPETYDKWCHLGGGHNQVLALIVEWLRHSPRKLESQGGGQG